LLVCDPRDRKCSVLSSDPLSLPITLPSATRSLHLLGTSTFGSLQAFTWNVSPRSDHRMGYLQDHAESLGPGPSILSWMLPKGTSSRCGRWLDREHAANFVAVASFCCSTLLADARLQRHRAVSRPTRIQLRAVERLAVTADLVQRQGQLAHDADQGWLGSAPPLRLLPHIPAAHGLLPHPAQRRQIQPAPHHAGTTLQGCQGD
jgi:hypothetical protein